MFTVDVKIGTKAFMEADAAFGILAKTLDRGLDGAAAPLRADLRKTLQLVATKLAEKHGNPWSPGKKTNLQSRSGNGLKSIAQSIKLQGGANTLAAVAGRITTGKMTTHETGATVRAKSAGYLTIPLPAALDQRGVPLKTRAREWTNTFVARSKKGNLIIFQKKGRNNIVPLYVLKKEVTIPARLRMAETIQTDALPYFERKAFETIEKYIMEAI